MRKIREVLRLRYEVGLGIHQIAASCSVGHTAVAGYLKRAEAAGVNSVRDRQPRLQSRRPLAMSPMRVSVL